MPTANYNSKKKTITLKLEEIGEVVIANLADVRQHTIKKTKEGVLHELQFPDGGRFGVLFGTDGHVLGLEANKVAATLQPDKKLIVTRLSAPK